MRLIRKKLFILNSLLKYHRSYDTMKKEENENTNKGGDTMQAMITAAGTLSQYSALHVDLFTDFIAYVDRSQATARTYINNLKQFFAWLRYAAIDRPLRDDIINYRNWLCSEHDAIELDAENAAGWKYRTRGGHKQTLTCKVSTVRGYLQAVKQFFAWTASKGYYPNIAAGIHAPKAALTHKKDALSVEDVQAVERSLALSAADKGGTATQAAKDRAGRIQRSEEQAARINAIFALAINAGLRCVEISRANVEDLESRGGAAWIRVWGKGHAEADTRKAIAPEVYDAIKAYLNIRTDRPAGNAPLFISTGNRGGGKRMPATTISKLIKQALKGAGLDSPRLTAHSLRHTAGRAVMEMTGDNIYKTQQYMRHTSPATTEIYLDNSTAKQDAAIAAQLYQHFHSDAQAAAADQLQAAINKLNPAKLEKLAAIVQAMAD